MTFGLPLEPPDVPTDPSALGSLLDTAAAQVASHKGQAGSGAAFDNEQARSITARLRFRKTLLQVCSSGLQEWISQPAVHTLSLSLFWDVCFGTCLDCAFYRRMHINTPPRTRIHISKKHNNNLHRRCMRCFRCARRPTWQPSRSSSATPPRRWVPYAPPVQLRVGGPMTHSRASTLMWRHTWRCLFPLGPSRCRCGCLCIGIVLCD